MKKFLCLIALLPLVTSSNPSEDDCNQKKDQSSCDALGCSWCTAGAVPPSCHTLANAAKLPSAVFKCDKTLDASSDNTILDLVENDSSLSELLSAFRSSGLTSYLEKSNVTLFAYVFF